MCGPGWPILFNATHVVGVLLQCGTYSEWRCACGRNEFCHRRATRQLSGTKKYAMPWWRTAHFHSIRVKSGSSDQVIPAAGTSTMNVTPGKHGTTTE